MEVCELETIITDNNLRKLRGSAKSSANEAIVSSSDDVDGSSNDFSHICSEKLSNAGKNSAFDIMVMAFPLSLAIVFTVLGKEADLYVYIHLCVFVCIDEIQLRYLLSVLVL